MMRTLPIAAGGIEVIIWLVVFLFYSLAQLANKKRKSGQPPGRPTRPARPRPPGRTAEDELKDFLEKLSGQAPAAPPKPRPAPPPPPTPRRAPAPVRTTVAAPVSDLMQTEARVISEDRPSRARPIPQPRRARTAASLFEDVQTPAHPTVKPSSFMVGLKGLSMPLMKIRFAMPHSQHPAGVQVRIRGPQELKKAMLHQVLLGPPLALREDPTHF